MKKMLGVLAVVLLGAGLAAADDETLKGTYRVIFFRSCLQARETVDGVPFPPGSESSRTASRLGNFHYNGHGSGTAELETFQVIDTRHVSKSRTTCDIENVVVNDDGSFRQDLVNCMGTVEEGPSADLDFVITPTSHQGLLTSKKKVMILANVDFTVQTITFTRTDGTTFSRERMCPSSATGLKVKERRRRRGHDKDKHRHRDKHKDDD